MASQTRTAREAEDRRLSIRTLAIASIASAAAAVIVSQFWKSGTAPAAAITPVVVTLISELLHKPSAAIATKMTSERTSVLPEGAGAGAPAQKTEVAAGGPARDFEASKPASEERPPPLRDEDDEAVPSDERPGREAPVSYYSSSDNGKPAAEGRRRIPWKIVATTAALAFVIGAAILTLPEIIAGESVGKTSGGTSLFGGGSDTSETQKDDSSDQQGSDQQDESPQGQSEQGDSQSDRQQDSSSEKRSGTDQESSPDKTTTQPQQQQRQAPSTPKTPAQP